MLQAAALLRLSSRGASRIYRAIPTAELAVAERGASKTMATSMTTATAIDSTSSRPSSSSSSQPRPSQPRPRLRVLFCGRDMHFGWQYTHEALRDDHDIEVVQCDREDAARLLPEFDVAVPLMTRLDAEALAAAGVVAAGGEGKKGGGKLRLVLQYGVGLEGIDLPAASRAGVAVSNIPSTRVPNALSCAEMALFLALAALRRAPELAASIRNKRLGAPPGRTLWGKRALLIGFGGIGRALAPRLRALGVEVDAVRRSPWEEDEEGNEEGEEKEKKKKSDNDNSSNTSFVCPPAPPPPPPTSSTTPSPPRPPPPPHHHLSDFDVDPLLASSSLSRKGRWSDLHSFAATADLAFLCCAENDETRGVVGDAFWARAKPGLVLVNVARGGLVDPGAAVRALRSQKAGALALDVQWEEPVDVLKNDFKELCAHERVFLTPHVAGVTEESYRGMAEVVAGAARRLAREGKVPERVMNSPVDLPGGD